MADSSYRPAVYRERGGNKFVVAATGSLDIEGTHTVATGGSLNVQGTQNVQSGGAIALATGSALRYAQRTATQAISLTESESGQLVITKVKDLEHSLPAATGAGVGAHYRFVVATGALSTGNGLRIAPQTGSGDKFRGNGLTAATGKRLTLAGSGDRDGDAVTIESDGAGNWYITSVVGTWTLTTAT